MCSSFSKLGTWFKRLLVSMLVLKAWLSIIFLFNRWTAARSPEMISMSFSINSFRRWSIEFDLFVSPTKKHRIFPSCSSHVVSLSIDSFTYTLSLYTTFTRWTSWSRSRDNVNPWPVWRSSSARNGTNQQVSFNCSRTFGRCLGWEIAI